MKSTIITAVIFLALTHLAASAQSADEMAIRKVSALEVEAFLKNDTIALNQLWSPSYVVMNPFNKIVTRHEINALMKNVKINQVRFERLIEKITIHQNIATEMGVETPDEKTASAGVAKQVLNQRRFTNIWMRQANGWQLVSRQATNICP